MSGIVLCVALCIVFCTIVLLRYYVALCCAFVGELWNQDLIAYIGRYLGLDSFEGFDLSLQDLTSCRSLRIYDLAVAICLDRKLSTPGLITC